MRRTLIAEGLAVLVSMLLAPHGAREHISGYGPFFSHKGLADGYWGDLYVYEWNGHEFIREDARVMIDMLALETVFLAVLFALVVNIRWRRQKSEIGSK